MSDTNNNIDSLWDIDVIRQSTEIKTYLLEHVPDLTLNDICYAFDVLCYLLSKDKERSRLIRQSHITDRSIDQKIELIHHTARFAFNLELDKDSYQRMGLRYIELMNFNTAIMKDFSIKDSLTGALSYDYLKSLDDSLSKKNFLLFFFDVDNLKVINDEQGHEAGNQLLKTFSNVLIKSVRSNDLVFRYGGDEFIIVLADHHLDPQRLIERINGHLDHRIRYSVGWAYNQDYDLFKAIKVADALMYKNKREQQ